MEIAAIFLSLYGDNGVHHAWENFGMAKNVSHLPILPASYFLLESFLVVAILHAAHSPIFYL